MHWQSCQSRTRFFDADSRPDPRQKTYFLANLVWHLPVFDFLNSADINTFGTNLKPSIFLLSIGELKRPSSNNLWNLETRYRDTYWSFRQKMSADDLVIGSATFELRRYKDELA